MSQAEKNENFDLEKLRRKVAENAPDGDGQAAQQHVPLNPLARQIAEQFRQSAHSPDIMIGQFRIAEFALLTVFSTIFNAIWPVMAIPGGLLAVMAVVAAGAALCVFLLQTADTYQIPALRMPFSVMVRMQAIWAASFALMIAAMSLLNPATHISFGNAVAWYMSGAVVITVWRFAAAKAIRAWGRNGVMERRAVIIGGGQPARELIRALEQQPDNDIRICGIFDDRNRDRSPDVVAGYPKLGTFAELVEFARLARVDMMIVSLPLTAENRILELMRRLWILPVDIRIAAHANRLKFRPRSYSHIGKVPMLDVFDKPIRDWDSVAKRLFDVFFATVAILTLWPVMLAAAIAVKVTSKGPALFVQKRHGFNNEVINVLKFRSMYTDMGDPTAKKAVTRNDPRVTPVGRFIRKTSIDELPQLFNVLKGDLSLVGPRPHAVHAQTGDLKYAEVVESYFARHKVKPGVTGWAQINGWRGEIDNSDKIRFRTAFDLYYIENWSLLFDLKILFLTPIRLLKSENAY